MIDQYSQYVPKDFFPVLSTSDFILPAHHHGIILLFFFPDETTSDLGKQTIDCGERKPWLVLFFLFLLRFSAAAATKHGCHSVSERGLQAGFLGFWLFFLSSNFGRFAEDRTREK